MRENKTSHTQNINDSNTINNHDKKNNCNTNIGNIDNAIMTIIIITIKILLIKITIVIMAIIIVKPHLLIEMMTI